MKLLDKKKKILFSDVDGTLCFHKGAHGIREIRNNHDGSVTVEDPGTGNQFRAFDVSVSQYSVYLAEKTRNLGLHVQEHCEFVYVTGGRPSTVLGRKEYFDFADAVILENGGLIFDNDYNIVEEWYNRLEPQRKYLKNVAKKLEHQNWVLDAKGRTSAIRVRKKDNPHKSIEEFERLCKEIQLPSDLKKTVNLDNLDIILADAGKDNAVAFWMNYRGYEASESIGIGDDINDIDFLKITGTKYVLASSYPSVIERAKSGGWCISEKPTFDGIHETLEKILTDLENERQKSI